MLNPTDLTKLASSLIKAATKNTANLKPAGKSNPAAEASDAEDAPALLAKAIGKVRNERR